MEAATIPVVGADTPSVERAEEDTRPQEAVATKATPEQMFKFSAFVHVGDGAEECPGGEDGTCQDQQHFHAWCRLPNKFQHRDCHEKGMAAMARRKRLLRDPDSDGFVSLEGQMAELGDDESLVDVLVQEEWAKDYIEAVNEVNQREGYEHIEADRERFHEMSNTEGAKPEAERSDEYRELERHIERYVEVTRDALREIQEPKRQALRALGREGLLEKVREQKVEDDANEVFLHVYNSWAWFIGTLSTARNPATNRPHLRKWTALGSIDEPAPGTMWGESPEVIDAIERTFADLESRLQTGALGNS